MNIGRMLRSAFMVFGMGAAHAAWVPCDTLPSRSGDIVDLLSYGRYLFVAIADDGLFRSLDDGRTWTRVKVEADNGSTFPIKPRLIQSLHGRDSLLLVGDLDGGVLRSADSGATWKAPDKVHDGGNAYDFISVGSTLYTIGGGFYRSTDNGKSWPPVPGNFSTFAYWFGYNGTAFFTGCSNGVYRSLDQGATWTKIHPFSDSPFCPIPNSSVVLLQGSLHLQRSADNGATWAVAETGLNGAQAWCDISIGNGFFVGTNKGGVFRSSDQGLSYESLGMEGMTDSTISALAIHDGFLFAGSNPRIRAGKVFRRPLSEVLGPIAIRDRGRANPVHPGEARAWIRNSATLSVLLVSDLPVELGIYNASGAIIRTLRPGRLTAGRHEIKLWPALPAGSYQPRVSVAR
jgi:photosystem II stability/assembly factor-like uncharacterized protein